MKITVIALMIGALAMADNLPDLSPSIEADADYLLTTTDFMKAQFGMAVEDVKTEGGNVVVRTTGAEFVFEPAKGLLHFNQRLGKAREAVVVNFPKGALDGLAVDRKGTGAVLLSDAHGRLTLRINADSVLMMKPSTAMDLSYTVGFAPASMREYGTDYLWLDEYGAVGSYIAAGPVGARAEHEGLTARYNLNPRQVFWMSVCPPRPYDWEASFRDRVVWHASRQNGYPSDAEIADWSRYGNMLLQQSEVMLWKDWNLRFIPRNGIEEFQRVNETCRKSGMRNYVYTSPSYFLTGTGQESKAMNSFDHFDETGLSPYDLRGLNWPIFLGEITKVMREYKPQGLYFDGIYGNIVRSYLITRKAREIVGDGGILEYHATLSPPGGGVYLPQTDTYFNIVLRGESCQGLYQSQDFLRYFVSTYNISNSIGVLCNDNDYKLDEAFINKLLDNNIRLHLMSDWAANDYRLGAMKDFYWPALQSPLEARVESKGAEREATAAEDWAAMQAAEKQGTAGLKLEFAEDFSSPNFRAAAPPPPADHKPQLQEPAKPVYSPLPNGWQAYFSANNEGTMAAEGRALRIVGRTNTCAYIERELPADATVVQCKIRLEAGAGWSWGPALMLRTPRGPCLINAREDGQIGVDHGAGQSLAEGYQVGSWYWLRLRIVRHLLFYEVSRDGRTWSLIARVGFEPSGPLRLVVGKVSDMGWNTEYGELGGTGTCYLAEVKVFGP